MLMGNMIIHNPTIGLLNLEPYSTKTVYILPEFRNRAHAIGLSSICLVHGIGETGFYTSTVSSKSIPKKSVANLGSLKISQLMDRQLMDCSI